MDQKNSKVFQLTLEKIIGTTSSSGNSFKLHPVTGELVFLAGGYAVIYNPKKNEQTRFIKSPQRLGFGAVEISGNGKLIALSTNIRPHIYIYNYENLNENSSPQVLKGHKSGITSLVFSPNLQYIVSIGDENDKGLFVWDLSTSTRVTSNKISRPIYSCSFNPLGAFFVTGGVQHLKYWQCSPDGSIKGLSSDANSNVGLLDGKSASLGNMSGKSFNGVHCTKNMVYAITTDGHLCLLNNQRAIVKWVDIKISRTTSVICSEEWVLGAGTDSCIRVLQLESLQYVTTLSKPPGLGMYNVEKGERPQTNREMQFTDVIALALDQANKRVNALYSDHSLFIWDVNNISKITVYRSFLFHSGPITDAQLLPNSSQELSFYATVSGDETLKIWYISDNEEVSSKENKDNFMRQNAYCKGLNKIIYTSSSFEHFKLRKSEEKANRPLLRCVKCSPDLQFIAVGDREGNIMIYSLRTFDLVHKVEAHNKAVVSIDFSPINDYTKHHNISLMVSASRDKLIHLYDMNAGFSLVDTLDDHTSSVLCAQFACERKNSIGSGGAFPGGAAAFAGKKLFLISTAQDRSVFVRAYYPETKSFMQVFMDLDKGDKFFTLQVSPDNSKFYIGQEKKLTVFSLSNPKEREVIEIKEISHETGQTNSVDVLGVAFDESGSFLAISSSDRYVRLRDNVSGRMLTKLFCGGVVTSMVFTSNNKNLITTTLDGCIQHWRLPNEMSRTIEKKKKQLGLLAKRIRECFNITGNLSELNISGLVNENQLKEVLVKSQMEGNSERKGVPPKANKADESRPKDQGYSNPFSKALNEKDAQGKVDHRVQKNLPSWAISGGNFEKKKAEPEKKYEEEDFEDEEPEGEKDVIGKEEENMLEKSADSSSFENSEKKEKMIQPDEEEEEEELPEARNSISSAFFHQKNKWELKKLKMGRKNKKDFSESPDKFPKNPVDSFKKGEITFEKSKIMNQMRGIMENMEQFEKKAAIQERKNHEDEFCINMYSLNPANRNETNQRKKTRKESGEDEEMNEAPASFQVTNFTRGEHGSNKLEKSQTEFEKNGEEGEEDLYEADFELDEDENETKDPKKNSEKEEERSSKERLNENPTKNTEKQPRYNESPQRNNFIDGEIDQMRKSSYDPHQDTLFVSSSVEYIGRNRLVPKDVFNSLAESQKISFEAVEEEINFLDEDDETRQRVEEESENKPYVTATASFSQAKNKEKPPQPQKRLVLPQNFSKKKEDVLDEVRREMEVVSGAFGRIDQIINSADSETSSKLKGIVEISLQDIAKKTNWLGNSIGARMSLNFQRNSLPGNNTTILGGGTINPGNNSTFISSKA